jgi:hypothetical protein
MQEVFHVQGLQPSRVEYWEYIDGKITPIRLTNIDIKSSWIKNLQHQRKIIDRSHIHVAVDSRKPSVFYITYVPKDRDLSTWLEASSIKINHHPSLSNGAKLGIAAAAAGTVAITSSLKLAHLKTQSLHSRKTPINLQKGYTKHVIIYIDEDINGLLNEGTLNPTPMFTRLIKGIEKKSHVKIHIKHRINGQGADTGIGTEDQKKLNAKEIVIDNATPRIAAGRYQKSRPGCLVIGLTKNNSQAKTYENHDNVMYINIYEEQIQYIDSVVEMIDAFIQAPKPHVFLYIANNLTDWVMDDLTSPSPMLTSFVTAIQEYSKVLITLLIFDEAENLALRHDSNVREIVILEQGNRYCIDRFYKELPGCLVIQVPYHNRTILTLSDVLSEINTFIYPEIHS